MPMQRLIDSRQILHILTLFLIVQFAGILVAFMNYSTIPVAELTNTQIASSPIDILAYIGWIVLFAIFLVIFSKIYKGKWGYVIIEGFAIAVASFFVFLSILGYFFPNADANLLLAISLFLGISLVAAKNKMPNLRNTAAVLSGIGIGVILGISFSFGAAMLFMLFIAFYDYIAVFVTKHMITLANAVSSRNLAFLVGSSEVRAVNKSSLEGTNKKELKEYIGKVKKIDNPIMKKVIEQGMVPIVSQIQLGGGDLGIPLVVAVSAYQLQFNYFFSVVCIIGATAGLVATMYFLKRFERPLPAIPPLFSGISVAVGIAFLATGYSDLESSVALIVLGLSITLLGMYLTLRSGERNAKKTA